MKPKTFPDIPLDAPSNLLVLLSALLCLAACNGRTGKRGPAGSAGGGALDAELQPDEDAPGVDLAIVSIGGATGAGGSFQAGDHISVRFTAKMDDGTDWDLADLSTGRILVSGPTFNYQRVLAEERDLATASVTNSDGSHTYTFAAGIPATYLPPLNDSPAFGPMDGELAGTPLLAGTYTVGLYAAWNYTVEGGSASYRDVGNVTGDFLFGGAVVLAPREVVKLDNCNQCHSQLQAHGGLRRDPALCVLCHTSGSEDRNTSGAGGTDETPGASIDFRVMIHKIHNGKHLPSVLGIGVEPDGTADYTRPPIPYQLVGFGNSKHDYSNVAFPVWPSVSVAMPRDEGHAALGATERALEDAMRLGVVSCYACHGDADGGGPLTAPSDGDLAYLQPTRRSCGSCHDDVDWTLPYDRNSGAGGQPMPPNKLDSECVNCHSAGNLFPVEENHLHPLRDPDFNTGFVIELTDLTDGAGSNLDGTIEPGERIDVTFRLVDDMGVEIDPSTVSSLSIGVAGPTTNQNLILQTSLPTAYLAGPQPFTVAIPMPVLFERIGTATMGGPLESFAASAHTPHWNVAGGLTSVHVATGVSGASGNLSADAPGPSNYLDLGVGEGAAFDRDDFVVIDSGGPNEECLRVQWVDGDRLWFNSGNLSSTYPAGTAFDHDQGELVEVVDVPLQMNGASVLVQGLDYSVDELTGVVTELSDFPDGAVLVSYTTDLRMPATYPLALNASPDIDETWGKWTGKPVADGTYKATMWGYIGKTLVLHAESNSYRLAAEGVSRDFLVDNPLQAGTPTTTVPWDRISSIQNCLSCHQDILFHGAGRRGVESCLLCHGSSGGEDRPRYVAANAPATTAAEIRFRELLHKIHMGAELEEASTYTVVGFGSGYPDNFSEHTYEEVEFPAFPDGVKNCVMCHGEGNQAWRVPAPAEHPTSALLPGHPWRSACGSCHDGAAVQAHVAAQTSPVGVESCSVCHEEASDLGIEVVHKVR